MANGRTNLTSYLVAMVLVGSIVVGGVSAVGYLNPGHDNTATIVIIVGFGVTILGTVTQFLKAQEAVDVGHQAKKEAQQATIVAEKTGKAVDGKMTEFEKVLREWADEKIAAVKAESKAAVNVAEVAAARAEGQVEMAKQVIAAAPAVPPSMAITNGDHAVKVELVPGHVVGEDAIVPPGAEKKS